MSYFKCYVVNGRDAYLLYEDSDDDGEERRYTTIPNDNCSLKMLHLLAITRAFLVADELMFDHEFPEEEIEEFFNKFGQEWHRVLMQSDETLGFGLIKAFSYGRSTLVSAATEMAARRSDAALDDLLDFQSLFEHHTPDQSRQGLNALLEFHGSWLEDELNQRSNEVDFEISLVSNEEDNDDVEEEDEEGEEEAEDEEEADEDDQM